MAALNFPNSPSLNDTHTENGVTFKWNGAAWDRLGDIGAQGSAGAAGAQGAAGAAGAQGATGPVAGSSSQVVYKDGSNNPSGSANFTFDGTNLSVSGNVSIGGTLTYEDVTNIDSVGIVTARAGVKVPDNQKVFLGTGDDLQIYHTGTNSLIVNESDSGNLYLRNKDADKDIFLQIAPIPGFVTDYLRADGSTGEVILYASGIQKLSTKSTGVSVTGNLDVSNHINLLGDLDMGDSDFIRLGASDDLLIYHSGTTSYIKDVGTGNLNLDTNGSAIVFTKNESEDLAKFITDGAVELYYDNSKKFETTSSGVKVSGSFPDFIIHDTDTTNDNFRILHNSGGTQLQVDPNNVSSGSYLLAAIDGSEKLRITSDGKMGLGISSPARGGLHIHKAATAELHLTDDTTGSSSGDGFTLFSTSSSAGVWYRENAPLRFATYNTERVRISSGGNVGINETAPDRTLHVNSGATDTALKLESTDTEVSLELADNTGSSYIGGGGNYLNFYSGNNERLRITSSGEVNIGGSDMTQTIYAFSVSKDLGTPSASGTNLVHFKNANPTYQQNLYLGFNNSKDIIWTGGSGNGGMTWKMGTRGYNWEIGGTNKFAVGPSNATLNGTTDGVLNINTTDGRGSFIRFQENGTSKVWIGSGEGMGVGDQDDACLMSVDNIYFRNSTDSYTTLTVSKEGRLTGNKRYPDASGTLRSNPYYPPTNQYQTYSAPSGGGKWLRFGYFSSRGRYRITFNSTGGHYSPGSVTFDFQLTWSSPHAYVGNIIELGPQYVTKFRVTSNSSGGSYYAEVYVNINGNQTGSHIHCTAQVLGTADREFNLYNYGYDLSNLTYTSGDFNI